MPGEGYKSILKQSVWKNQERMITFARILIIIQYETIWFHYLL